MARFPTTAWSQIIAAPPGPPREKLLRELLTNYWQPLYVFARSRGISPEDARDAVQSFCLALLRRGLSDRLSPQAGQLRSYLRASFHRHLIDEWRRDRSSKRNSEAVLSDLNPEELERATPSLHAMSPEEAFDLAFTQRSMQLAFDQLKAEFVAGKWKGPFEAFERSFASSERPDQNEMAAEYKMSVNQLRAFLFRVRRRYRTLLTTILGGVGDEAPQTRPLT